MNEFRRGPGEQFKRDVLQERKGMTGEELTQQWEKAAYEKSVDEARSQEDYEDQVGITTDREIDELLEVDEIPEGAQGGVEGIGLHRASRTEVPKKVEHKFHHGDQHRGDEKLNKPDREKPQHKQF